MNLNRTAVKALKDTKKVVALEARYGEVKGATKLSSYQQSVDLTQQAIEAREAAGKALEEHGINILSYLRDTPTLIPKIGDVRDESVSMLQDLPLQRNLQQTVVDHRGNPVEHFSTPEEIQRYWDMYTYNYHIECDKILFLRAVFIEGIKSGAVTAASFQSHLANDTWLSSKRKVWSPAIRSEETFVDLVMPSIGYFIDQTRRVIVDDKFTPDFVLCADSLTLKIEGLLRNLCEQSGETTFILRDDKANRKIVHEQDINALLYFDAIKRLFSESELIFLRFILIEKAGLNWRHKVAHALSHSSEYSFELMVLLSMGLLIVARKSIII